MILTTDNLFFFEKTSDIPLQATVRAQMRLPFPLAGLGLYSSADLSPCAYVGSLLDTARLRADGRKKSPLLHEILGKADPILQSLRPYLQTLPESLPLTTLSLQEAPESSQNELSQVFFRKRTGIVALEEEWDLLKDKSDADMDWNVVRSRRRILALREPGANSFLTAKPNETLFCSRELWSVMMKLYLGCVVYDDSGSELLVCGCCGKKKLDRLGIHALTCCGTGWGRVARHDLTAKTTQKHAIGPARLAYEGKYHKGEAKNLLFGSSSKPADVLVYPPACANGQTIGLPIAMDFMVTGSFCLTNVAGRSLAKQSASSGNVLVLAGEKFKWLAFQAKVKTAWKKAFPQVPYPAETPELGFEFLPMLFDIYGGCSARTQTELERYAKRAAKHQGTSQKKFYNRVYSRISYCIWSANAQCVILRKPRDAMTL